ncbi:hypothetical protein M0804_011595 [Polistes exclamans]|nr:hypothetical protein M0804_011595 [Polistes exclamans]
MNFNDEISFEEASRNSAIFAELANDRRKDFLRIFIKLLGPIENKEKKIFVNLGLDSVNGTGRIHGSFKPLTRGAPVPYTASGFPTCS